MSEEELFFLSSTRVLDKGDCSSIDNRRQSEWTLSGYDHHLASSKQQIREIDIFHHFGPQMRWSIFLKNGKLDRILYLGPPGGPKRI